MTSTLSYLDYNATAPAWPAVRAAMAAALAEGGNPSAVHTAGRAARKRVEDAREQVAQAFGCRAEEVVFTSGASEANGLALRGLAENSRIDRVIVSAVEHPSLLASAEATGLPVEVVSVGPDGVLSLDAFDRALGLAGERTLVSVMVANNETGVIQPLAEVVARAHARGALVHSDGAQAPGRLELSVTARDLDLVSLSAHKLGGPTGIGALIVRQGLDVSAQVRGGGQERGRRGGTENVSGIAGFGAAAAMVPELLQSRDHMRRLRDQFEAELLARVPDAVIHGASAPRLPNTSAFALPGLPAELQVIALDLAGVAVSAGAACSSGKVKRSAVLDAMGTGSLAGESIRVSLGWQTREDEIAHALDVIEQVCAKREAIAPAVQRAAVGM